MAPILATIATKAVANDLKIFLLSLVLFNIDLPRVVIVCDTPILEFVCEKIKYAGTIILTNELDEFSQLTRAQMEQMPGKEYKTLHEDLMMKKATAIEYAFQLENATEDGVTFVNCDIFFTGPLPIIPAGKKLAVSPHMIRETKEMLFGKYNGGYLWTRDIHLPSKWREYSKKAGIMTKQPLKI